VSDADFTAAAYWPMVIVFALLLIASIIGTFWPRIRDRIDPDRRDLRAMERHRRAMDRLP
jgi:cbb3-type cytochrome oxidase subunit 3